MIKNVPKWQLTAAAAICPGLQSGKLPAQAMLAEGNQRLVIAKPSGEADQEGGGLYAMPGGSSSNWSEVAVLRALFVTALDCG